MLITIIAGAILGAVNGLLTARLLLPSFIVTVATMSIYRGLVSLPTGGAPLMISDPNWQAIGASHFLGVPLIIWILLVLFLANHIALSMTVFGRETYLTGGNREAALYSGIRVNRIKIIIFTLSGVMSAIAGILLSSRLYSAQTNAGLSYELDAIAAAVLGGTSLRRRRYHAGHPHRRTHHRRAQQRHEHALRPLLLPAHRQRRGHHHRRLAGRARQTAERLTNHHDNSNEAQA